MSEQKPTHFHCEGTHARITVSACVAHFRSKHDPACLDCPVGEEHAAGRTPDRWPDHRGGRPLVRLNVVPHSWIRGRVKRRSAP